MGERGADFIDGLVNKATTRRKVVGGTVTGVAAVAGAATGITRLTHPEQAPQISTEQETPTQTIYRGVMRNEQGELKYTDVAQFFGGDQVEFRAPASDENAKRLEDGRDQVLYIREEADPNAPGIQVTESQINGKNIGLTPVGSDKSNQWPVELTPKRNFPDEKGHEVYEWYMLETQDENGNPVPCDFNGQPSEKRYYVSPTSASISPLSQINNS